MKLLTAKSLREDFLQQNAFDDIDTYCSLEKQKRMLELILTFHDHALEGIVKGLYIREIDRMKVRERITRMRFIPEDEFEKFEDIRVEMEAEFRTLIADREAQDA